MEKITFNADLHLKPSNFSNERKKKEGNKRSQGREQMTPEEDQAFNENSITPFKRRILNPDTASCWLNACLQMILAAFDHLDHPLELESELGKSLIKIQNLPKSRSIDPSTVKNIIVLLKTQELQ